MKKLLFIFCSLLLISAKAQIVFDLADSKTKSVPIGIDKQPLLVVKNLVQNYKYEVEIKKKDIGIPPIKLDKMAEDSIRSLDLKAYEGAVAAFKKATKESEIPGLYKTLEKEIGKLDKAKYAKEIEEGNRLLANSILTVPLDISLQNNQEITVTITRYSSKDTVTWERTFSTPVKTPWHILYGFTFIPNLMNPVSQYYCKGDSASGFVISKLNNQNKMFMRNVSPTIMVGWTPMTKYSWVKGTKWKFVWSNNFYQFGITGGFSMNFASEAGSVNVLLAPSIVFCENVSFSFGNSFTQKQVLKGKYKEGDIVQENLDFDQLHEKQYMCEWFFSVSFRFQSNPFEKGKNSDK